MRGELAFSTATLMGFLLALARVGGALVFVPLPGIRNGPEAARIVLVLSIVLALFPVWPKVPAAELNAARIAGWMLAEAALGIATGLAVACLTEAFVLAAQTLGVQAGYAYASTIDPTTQADSSILLILSQLTSGMLFFAFGLDREIIRVFAWSFELHPPGSYRLPAPAAEAMLRLGAEMFSVGLRLALPVVALLVLVDLALALLGRINVQLQLLTLAFPVKMLAALGVLAWTAVLLPAVYRAFGAQVLEVIRAAAVR